MWERHEINLSFVFCDVLCALRHHLTLNAFLNFYFTQLRLPYQLNILLLIKEQQNFQLQEEINLPHKVCPYF